jgi:hypothetical protein
MTLRTKVDIHCFSFLLLTHDAILPIDIGQGNVANTSCGHVFHMRGCFSEWRWSCPICRQGLVRLITSEFYSKKFEAKEVICIDCDDEEDQFKCSPAVTGISRHAGLGPDSPPGAPPDEFEDGESWPGLSPSDEFEYGGSWPDYNPDDFP